MEDNPTTPVNSAHWTNRLPPELLSRAFVLGEGMQRGPRVSSWPYVGLQDLVVQVCQHWREVAIHTPVLWSHIFISQPPPHRHAVLYLARSGPSCPLDIDIEMKTPYIDGISRFGGSLQANRALETLQSIVAHGGQVARWRSLTVVAKMPQVIFKTISFINSEPTLALRFLSLTWKAIIDVAEHQEVDVLEVAPEVFDDNYALDFGRRRPQLQNVELNGIPKDYVFERASPLVSNLTSLKLATSFFLPSIRATSALFSASPRLESLYIDTTYADSDLFELAVAPLQVSLPLLRSFSLHAATYYNWSLCLLQIVNAPAVQHFELYAGVAFLNQLGDFKPLLRFLGAGRISGSLQCDQIPADQPYCGPIFPSLHHLELKLDFDLALDSIRQVTVQNLLQAYPMITQVTLSYPAMLAFSRAPTLLPNISHFKYYGPRIASFPATMQNIATVREEAGMRIPVLDIVFTGKSVLNWFDDDEGGELNYLTPLGGLVGKLDIQDEHPDVSDSDDDLVYSDEMIDSGDDMDAASVGWP
ncbi:hypothetical protein BDV93DRAFT_606425 [Ceratobasidium sp. AG-I]|nr:hypothetical protein BDV93DRAFT_606425 [Ceratobasidium sp. AG-I]